MITTTDGLKARTVKCASELQNQRTVEKLEIERRYWEYIGVDWKIVTEHEIPKQKCRNIEWLYVSADIPEYLSNNQIRQELFYQINSAVSIAMAVETIDNRFELPPGSGLRLLKNIIWHKELACDMERPLATAILNNQEMLA